MIQSFFLLAFAQWILLIHLKSDRLTLRGWQLAEVFCFNRLLLHNRLAQISVLRLHGLTRLWCLPLSRICLSFRQLLCFDLGSPNSFRGSQLLYGVLQALLSLHLSLDLLRGVETRSILVRSSVLALCHFCSPLVAHPLHDGITSLLHQVNEFAELLFGALFAHCREI